MKLVVDTNIIFSLFNPKSFTNEFIKSFNLELFAPISLLKELSKYSDVICLKAKISSKEFFSKISLLPKIINFQDPLESSKLKADRLISHKTDVPFLALALEFDIPIWSNDKHFKEQSSIKVFTTKELKSFLDSI